MQKKITVEAKANSRKESLEVVTDTLFRIKVHAPPVDGKANEAIIEALAGYFKIPRSSVKLLHGEKSKKKIFQVITVSSEKNR